MDIVYTDASRYEIGYIPKCTLDMAFGSGENSFELDIPSSRIPEGIGWKSLVYVPGTEYGGIVDKVGSDTTGDAPKAVYLGRTWHGVLESCILRPDDGKDYFEASGESNAVIAAVIARTGISSLFSASPADSGIQASLRARYDPAYTALKSMLSDSGAKLRIGYDQEAQRVVLSALPVSDLSGDGELDVDSGESFSVVRSYARTNHLICLGKGELAQRTVVDLFADEYGTVSQVQSLFGMDEVSAVYYYSDAEEAQLVESGTRKLSELQDADTCDVKLKPAVPLDIGDIVAGSDPNTGTRVSAVVSKKAVSIGRDGTASVSYEAGDPAVSLSGKAESSSGATYASGSGISISNGSISVVPLSSADVDGICTLN